MIAGFVGANGSGKTLAAVEAAMRVSKRFPDRVILSTVPLNVAQYEELTSWQQIVKAEPPFILLLDEVAALADSRSTLTLPPHIILYIGSLRHRDVVCFWTAPAWNWCDVRLRAVTTEAHELTPVVGRYRRDQAWRQTLVAMKNSRPTNNEQGDALPPRKGFPRFKFLPASKAYGVFPTRRDPMAISEFARICPECGLPKRKRDAYCKGHTPGITSIAASTGTLVPAVQRPIALQPAPHRSGEDLPSPPLTQALDGLDGAR